MKKTLFMLLLLPALSFAQHKIFMKSGEHLEGSVKSILNGIVTFSFKGNDIKVNQSDVQSIVFSNSTLPATTSQSKLRGVVTYFFNNNYGDKPDVGAEVYVKPITEGDPNEHLLEEFSIAGTYKELYNMTKKEEYLEKIKQYNVETEEKFKELDNKAFKYLLTLSYGKDIKRTTVDGSGNYSLELEPGRYQVVIVSKGRKGYSITEVSGKVRQSVVTIEAGETEVVDQRFPL